MAATHGVLWSDDRRHTAALGASAAEQVPASAPLFAYRLTPAVYVYETQRRIPRLAEPGALAARALEIGARIAARACRNVPWKRSSTKIMFLPGRKVSWS